MRTIVFIGIQKAGSSREAVRTAERLGYFNVVFTDRAGYVVQRNEFPDVHEMIYVNLNDKNMMREKIAILQKQGKIIEAIVSFVDPLVHTAALLCEEFCNKKLPTESIFKMGNKIETRAALKSTEFNMKHAVFNEADDLASFMEDHHLTYPVIVKSPASTGSKAVLKADNESQLEKNIKLLMEKYPEEPVLFEEYIDGPQYLVEVFVHAGQIHIVAIIEQEITQKQRFIVTGYSLLAKVPEQLYNEIYDAVRQIISILHFDNGSCHLELRRQNGQWKLIEINPRISGGAMNKMIEIAYGINFVEQIIKGWIGEEHNLEKKHERFVFAQYITLTAKGRLLKVTGKKKALKHEGVYDVFISPRKGAYLQPPLSMGHRYAYVLAIGSTIEEARAIAKAAAKEIKFHLG